jgi:hypothetical protein
MVQFCIKSIFCPKIVHCSTKNICYIQRQNSNLTNNFGELMCDVESEISYLDQNPKKCGNRNESSPKM